MPELPDVEIYRDAIERYSAGARLERITLANPFLLRSVEPPIEALSGRTLTEVRRLGKRIVLGFEGDFFAVVHLMIAGRFRWRAAGAKSPGKIVQASFEFERGTLHLTEAGSKRRASLHLVQGAAGLAKHDRGGLEPLECDLDAFSERLNSENRTLKRALCDPRLFSGIGNAYSDEILLRARLSPFQLSTKLGPDETEQLFEATRSVLTEWIERLRAQVGDGFPEEVTAFHKEMGAHGKFREPCPQCGTPIQRIAHKDNETNYCAGCQTGGKILADRALSRLLKDDWPKSLDEL